MINNAINSDIKASSAEALAGVSTRSWMTPLKAKQALNARLFSPKVQNIGLSTTGGVLTVLSENGTNFSATNVGSVILPSKSTPGQDVRYVVTANQALTFATGFTAADNLGIPNSVIWSNLPLYLYAVANSAETSIAFMLSRVPHLTTSPSSTFMGSPGSAGGATTQGSMFSLTSVTLSDYASNPCMCLGSLLVARAAGASNWTLNAISTSFGIGIFADTTMHVFPTNQMNAATGKYFINNGGTALSGGGYLFKIDRFGFCTVHFDVNGGTGSGAVNAQLALPFVPESNGRYTGFIRTDSASQGTRPTTNYLRTVSGCGLAEFYMPTTGLPLLYSSSISNIGMILQYKVSNA